MLLVLLCLLAGPAAEHVVDEGEDLGEEAADDADGPDDPKDRDEDVGEHVERLGAELVAGGVLVLDDVPHLEGDVATPDCKDMCAF